MFLNKFLFSLNRIEINKIETTPEGFVKKIDSKFFHPSYTFHTCMGDAFNEEVLNADKLFKLYQLTFASHKNQLKREI